ncbi:MAG: DUF1257 domain-containing protein [Synechococcaceae cyanobacterium]|nr:DUF1257 domain-containing protein [Synechococcaceae cyanobacterium]
MSHLSILPTVLRDADLLVASLASLKLLPQRDGSVHGFGEEQAVEVRVTLADGQTLGWSRQSDGSLALVGDLQRLSRSRPLQRLLGRITRAYAAHQAVAEAATLLGDAVVFVRV